MIFTAELCFLCIPSSFRNPVRLFRKQDCRKVCRKPVLGFSTTENLLQPINGGPVRFVSTVYRFWGQFHFRVAGKIRNR